MQVNKIHKIMGPLLTVIYIFMAAGILLSPLPFYWMTYVKNPLETASSLGAVLPGLLSILFCAAIWVYLVFAHLYIRHGDSEFGSFWDGELFKDLVAASRPRHYFFLGIFGSLIIITLNDTIWVGLPGTCTTCTGADH